MQVTRESFSYSVLIHSHNLIQEFCGIPLCLSCSVCIDIHGSALRPSVLKALAHPLAVPRLITGSLCLDRSIYRVKCWLE